MLNYILSVTLLIHNGIVVSSSNYKHNGDSEMMIKNVSHLIQPILTKHIANGTVKLDFDHEQIQITCKLDPEETSNEIKQVCAKMVSLLIDCTYTKN